MPRHSTQVNTNLKPWLQNKLEKARRGEKDEDGNPIKFRRNLDDALPKRNPDEIWKMIHARSWPYRANKETLRLRDRVLLDLLYVAAPRISEALRLRKGQFDLNSHFDFVVIRNLLLSKRKRLPGTRHGLKGPKYREEVPLPREGPLAPFTEEIETWVIQLPKDAWVFPKASRYNGELLYDDKEALDRRRAWAIVKHVTGQWCHYFRSQGESYYANVFKTAWALKDFMGLTDTKTLDRYVKTRWQDYHKELLGQ